MTNSDSKSDVPQGQIDDVKTVNIYLNMIIQSMTAHLIRMVVQKA